MVRKSLSKIAKIYRITNQKNGYIYIGSTLHESIDTRLQEHFHTAQSKVKSNLLYNDMRNQSKTDFTIELIDTCEPRHRYMIEEYYTKQALSSSECVYNQKLGNHCDKNTAQRISTARKKYANEHPEKFGEQFRESCIRQGAQNGMYGKSGANAINGRAVYMLNDNHEVVKIFPSVQEAKRYLNTKAHTALCRACRNGTKYHGYYWRKEWNQKAKENKK